MYPVYLFVYAPGGEVVKTTLSFGKETALFIQLIVGGSDPAGVLVKQKKRRRAEIQFTQVTILS